MKTIFVPGSLAVLLAVALLPAQAAAATSPAATAHDAHQHAAAAAVPERAVPAKRWATDAPLREGMGRIRKSVHALAARKPSPPSPKQATALAGDIERDVNFLIANCKLEPAADAALHGIIGKLLQGAHAVKADPADPAAIVTLRAALAEYARTFDDPAVSK